MNRSPAIGLSVMPARDMDASPFSRILGEFLTLHRGVTGAALVDHDGETVDYSGKIEAYDLRVLGAVMQVTERAIGEAVAERAGPLRAFAFGSPSKVFIYCTLQDGYGLALQGPPDCVFEPDSKAVRYVAHLLSLEAGWASSAPMGLWHRAAVELDAAKKPCKLHQVHDTPGEGALGLDVLGTFLDGEDWGARIRLSNGAECNIAQDIDGVWYVDETPESLLKQEPAVLNMDLPGTTELEFIHPITI
jgi:hypothetical protein